MKNDHLNDLNDKFHSLDYNRQKYIGENYVHPKIRLIVEKYELKMRKENSLKYRVHKRPLSDLCK